MKKRLVCMIMVGVVLTGCGAKEPQPRETSTVEDEVTTMEESTFVSEYPIRLNENEIPDFNYSDSNNMIQIDRSYHGNVFSIVAGETGDYKCVQLRYVQSDEESGISEVSLFSNKDDCYLIQGNNYYKVDGVDNHNFYEELDLKSLMSSYYVMDKSEILNIDQTFNNEFSVVMRDGTIVSIVSDGNMVEREVVEYTDGFTMVYSNVYAGADAMVESYIMGISDNNIEFTEMFYEDAVNMVSDILVDGIAGTTAEQEMNEDVKQEEVSGIDDIELESVNDTDIVEGNN